MLSLTLKDLSPADAQKYMVSAIAPRPIAFVSTINAQGEVNLSPFSYFNMMSIHPPICVFSPTSRVRDNSHKHTLLNVQQVKQCVINIVDYKIVQQSSLSSTEYADGVNEFTKAGLTMQPSAVVAPPRVQEAPVQMECEVQDIISLGQEGGAGNMVICKVLVMHIAPHVLNQDNFIDQHKLDAVARLGEDWYCRATPKSLFRVPKPLRTLGIGVDALPHRVRNSLVLTGNDLGILGNMEEIPTDAQLEEFKQLPEIKDLLDAHIGDDHTRNTHLHQQAKAYIAQGEYQKAFYCVFL